jgi:hypothetical protein
MAKHLLLATGEGAALLAHPVLESREQVIDLGDALVDEARRPSPE